MKLKVITPERTLFEGEVRIVKLPGAMGQFTVLEHHAPLVSTLTEGKIIYKADEDEKNVEIKGGVAEIRNNQVTVCVN